MSENTNKIFWITALGIIITAVCILFFQSVTKPTKNLYDNVNNLTLCASSSRKDSLICLDASNNSKLEGYHSNDGSDVSSWFAQSNLEEQDNGKATLHSFNFNDDSGWLPYALKFDGVDDYVTLGLQNINFKNGLTGQINIKPLVENKEMTLLSNGNVTLKIKNNRFVYSLKTSTGTYELTANRVVTADTWYLVHITYNNDRMKIYINGDLSIDKEISGTISTTATDFKVGQNTKAEISSVMIYNKDIEENGINQNTVAIYEKVYVIDRYRENFNATNSCELWTAPMTGEYQFELWGAQGGSINGGTGGKGAYTSGNLVLTKGDTYYVCVGQQGATSSNLATGGNSADIRTSFSGNINDFNSLKTRIMIAAGGGGGNNALGGAGGTLQGLSSKTEIANIKNAKGGTQSMGGEKATNISIATDTTTMSYTNGSNGKFGVRGTASTGATGGNGYFSGGSISNKGGAAGGSSYISGHPGVNSLSTLSTASSIINSGSVKHYSNIVFYSTKMITGESEMPSSTNVNTTQVGQTGNAHARISYISDNKESHAGTGTTAVKPGKPIMIKDVETYSSFVATYAKVENAKAYACYYGATSTNLNFNGTITRTPSGELQCNANGLSQNTDYFVKMVAINEDQSTESDINKLHTGYAKPGAPKPIEITADENSLNAVFTTDFYAETYTCHAGTLSSNLTMTGTVTVHPETGKLECKVTGLDQNTKYYVQVTAHNHTESTDSSVISVNTTYASLTAPELLSSNTNYESIVNTYKAIPNASSYRCEYGTTNTNLNLTGTVTVDTQGRPVCTATGLTQGTNYYFKLTAMNGPNSSISAIDKVQTKYREPEKPVEIKKTVTNNSITTNFTSVNYGQTYECIYGTNINSLTSKTSATTLADGSKQCNFSGLTQNTTYYYQFVVKNGDKTTYSDKYNATTLYNNATKPVYKNGNVNSNTITSVWTISANDESYTCELSTDESVVTAIATPTISGTQATCVFSGLESDQQFYTRLVATNGPNTANSDWHANSIEQILPSITATNNGVFTNTNWAKSAFTVSLKTDSDDRNSIWGVVYCKGSGAQCTPQYTIAKDGTEDDDDLANSIVPGTNTSVAYMTNTSAALTTNVAINSQGKNQYVCAKAITYKGVATATTCFGPYNLDTEAPEISFEDVTIADTVTSYGMYTGVTISDNISTDTELAKSYDTTPTWGTAGTYNVKYTVTDKSGNTTTKTRKFTITATEYTISYTLNDGTISGQPTKYTKTTETFTLPTPTRTGYTFDGWTGSNGTTKQKTVTITKGSTGNKSYTANWTVTTYNITYNLNSGTGVSNRTYNINTATFTLPTPTRTGYIFDGWTGSNGTTKQKTVTISKGTTGDKSYTANWTKYNSTTIGGVYIVTHRDGSTWSANCDGEYAVGDTDIHSGNWKVTVEDDNVHLYGTKSITVERTYELWVYQKDDHTKLLGYMKKTFAVGNHAVLDVSW